MYLLIEIILNLLKFYSYLLIAFALLSWFPGAYDTKIGRLLVNLVNPVLRPFRRLRLSFAGLDFTIIVVLFFIQILSQILSGLLF